MKSIWKKMLLVQVCCLLSVFTAGAAVLISGNNAAAGNGPIQTYDFSLGRQINSFVPDGARRSDANGRGIAIEGGEIFYTELTNLFGPSDGIHVAPYGTDGYGGGDIRVLPNPRPSVGIQALSFLNGNLYALTGYPSNQPEVFELDASTGSVISGPISIGTNASPDCDGFVVLTNGNFLINDGDKSPVYREYSGATGSLVPGGLVIDLTTLGFSEGTGVTLSPHADSFYFMADFDTLVNTGLRGALISSHSIGGTQVEGIAVVETPSCDIYARDAQISSTNFSFDIFGFAGTNWTVYDSSDLTNWTSIGSVTVGSSGAGSFTDTSIAGVPYRFYKLSDSNCCSQAIGFVRIPVGAGTTNSSSGTNSLLANQLDSQNGNTLDGLFNVNGTAAMPDGTALFDGSVIKKWDVSTQSYLSYTWNSGTGWLDQSSNPAGTITLNPGEGAFLVTSNAITVTFVGLVPEGSLGMTLGPSEFYVVSAMLPKFGGIQTGLAYTPNPGDVVETWNGAGFTTYSFLVFGHHWSPQEPVIQVGQAFFVQPAITNTWQIDFSDCP